VESSVQDRLIERITFAEGQAEIWRVFEDADLFRAVVEALSEPWKPSRPTKVAGVEARGFILGAAVAHVLGTGFVAVRKEGSLFAGAKVATTAKRDYQGRQHRLRLRRESLTRADRVVLVDDWCQTGHQAQAAARLIRSSSAEFLGLSVIVDQAGPEIANAFPRYLGLVQAEELKGGSLSS